MSSLADRLRKIEERIARACDLAGRDPGEVCLVAVSKTYPREAVWAAYDLGLRHFGESRLQEAIPKQEGLPDDIIWHFIGPLQSNKAKRAAQSFHVIHSLCSKAQLDEIAKSGSTVEGLLQINLGREQQKSGIFAEGLDAALQDVLNCPQVQFRGLMTIGPLVENSEEARLIFRRLAELGREVNADWLSMGMSGDFEVAIQEGSTHIRVGSALFGS